MSHVSKTDTSTHAKQPTTRKRTRDRQATEAALLAAATDAFVEQGYENATTRAIAEAAGYSEALIQRYFDGKEGLLLAVIQQAGNEAEQTSFFDRPLCESLLDEAREMLAYRAAHFEQRSAEVRIVMSRVLVDQQFRHDFNRITVRNLQRRALTKRFERYAEAGMLAPELKPASVAELLIGLSFDVGFIHREIIETEPADIEGLIADFATMFARAVSK